MKITWTDFAIESLKYIFDFYHKEVNGKVARQIRSQILNSTKKLKNNPKMGPLEPNLKSLRQNHRYLVSGNYKIIFRVTVDEIIINDVFDTRQNPTKMLNKGRLE